MQKDKIPAGSDVSSGTFECNNCGNTITMQSATSIPPCPKCEHGEWKSISGSGDAADDPK